MTYEESHLFHLLPEYLRDIQAQDRVAVKKTVFPKINGWRELEVKPRNRVRKSSTCPKMKIQK